jgi:predicted metal-binding membrane protein
MFAVGVMNVVWMAALGLIMATEKLAATTRFSRAVGVGFGMIGVGLVGTAIAAHWPR